MTTWIPMVDGMATRSAPCRSPLSRTLLSASSSAARIRLDAREKFRACLGRDHRSLGTGQEPRAESGFGLGNHPGHLRLRETTFPRRCGKAAEPGHARAEAKRLNVLHRATRSNSSIDAVLAQILAESSGYRHYRPRAISPSSDR